MTRIYGAVLLIVAAAFSYAADSAEFGLFELREVLDRPRPGSIEKILVREPNKYRETVILGEKPLMTGASIASAEAQKNVFSGDWEILVKFTDAGTKQFAEITRANIGRKVAVIAGGKLQCAPRVNEQITGGNAVISGNFSEEEVRKLAKMLNDAVESSSEATKERPREK